MKKINLSNIFYIIIMVVVFLLGSCGTYQYAPADKCCQTEVVYVEDLENDSINLFTSLEFETITLDFRPRFHRGSDWYWGRTYGYWGHRPLWMDFGFYNGYSNYYFSHPMDSWYYWNYWDNYMYRPWRPYNNWYQGPFNNPGYNVVYNASRRNSLTSISNTLTVNRNKPRVNVNNTVVDDFIANYKPNNNSNNNNIRVQPNNNWKPNNNNIIIKPNNNYRPSNNSRPVINNSRPVINNSRPSNNSRPVINNSRSSKGIN